jgi:organic radical activating enzyme
VDCNSVTYRQLIQESIKSSKSRSDAFEKVQDDIIRERNRIQTETSAVLAIENEKAQKVLKKANNIKQAAESIIETHQSKRKGNRIGGLV